MPKQISWEMEINGKKFYSHSPEPMISYGMLVGCAFEDVKDGEVFDVTWLSQWGKTGSVLPGHTVRITPGIKFTVSRK